MIDQETVEPGHSGPTPPPASGVVGHASGRASRKDTEPAGSEPVEPFEPIPIGEYLRSQRSLRGVSIEELSSLTRIPLRSLRRLEDGEFDGETDGFVRGFVRTVAAAIGLDVDDTIARMLKEPAVGVWERHHSGRRIKQSLVVVALVALAIIALLVLQAGWRMLVGSNGPEPGREIVVWRDPVHALAEETGVEVDPAREIAPARGSHLETPRATISAQEF